MVGTRLELWGDNNQLFLKSADGKYGLMYDYHHSSKTVRGVAWENGAFTGNVFEYNLASKDVKFKADLDVAQDFTAGKSKHLFGTSFGEWNHRNIWINRSPSTPTGPQTGDMWFDKTQNKVMVYNASSNTPGWETLITGQQPPP